MKPYEFLDNAYWEDGIDDRSQVKCIRMTKTETGRKKDVLMFQRILPDGTECPGYKEVVQTVGIEKIDANTRNRREKKVRDERENRAKHEQVKQAKELEHLFALKLKAFEIEEIKNSEQKLLRTKLRRAKNEVEMNALATLIIGIELGIIDGNTQ
jgi:hypothetical protein